MCTVAKKTLMGRGYQGNNIGQVLCKENSEVWNPTPMVFLDHKEVPATSVDYGNLSIDQLVIILICQST
jgi:molybdopterin-containing oxidoreductase family iron-sulfur binding subunit